MYLETPVFTPAGLTGNERRGSRVSVHEHDAGDPSVRETNAHLQHAERASRVPGCDLQVRLKAEMFRGCEGR